MTCHLEPVHAGLTRQLDPRIDFFHYGKRDVLAEVRIQQDRMVWTKERRACFLKEAVSTFAYLKHTYPKQKGAITYYAGRVAALKSAMTADLSSEDATQMVLMEGRTVFSPLEGDDAALQGSDVGHLVLPLSVILGFGLLDLVSHVSTLGIIEEAVMVAGVAVLSNPILRVLFFLNNLADAEDQ